MSIWSASLTGRACVSVRHWLCVAWRVSLMGRLAAVAGRAVAAGIGGSRLLCVRGASMPLIPSLAAGSQSAGLLQLVARLYVAVARGLGEGWVGRGLRRAAASGDIGRRCRRPSVAVWSAVALAAIAVGLSAAAGPDTFMLLIGAALVAGLSLVVPFRAELLLLVLAAFPWIDWLVRSFLGSAWGGYWDEVLLIYGLLAVAISALILRRHELRWVPATVPILVALVLAVGSVVVNQVPDQVAQFALRVTFQPFLFYFLGVWLPKDRRWIKATVVVFLGASLLLALHGLYQYVTNAPMPASWVDTHENIGTRAYSIIHNPNGLGAFLLLGSMMAGTLALSSIGRSRRVICAVLTGILLAAVGVTFSRGAYIGLGAGFVAVVLLAFRPWLGRLLGVALVGALVTPRRFWDRLLFGFSSYYIRLSATNGRLYVWRIALLRMFDHPWWGVGLGTLGGTSAYMAGYGRLWIDSYYLQLGAEGGLLLLVTFLWILVRAGKGLVASFGGAADPLLRGIVAGVFGGFVAVCAAALTSSVWETLVVGAGFWFLAGVASSVSTQGEEERGLVPARLLGDEPPVGRLPRSRAKTLARRPA
ncbi:MAG: hypothetical protein GX604_05855 [Actinobacteria bacterium]|nr:hypothetical protein [Actinomycetota bacterium]